ncbi:hypothetical protein [Streptomyces sp. GESEQ-35]|uniref:hypothetical protein n=1 Tax=Streptomyces sp. GESEQ-35 TaxID=2812657 RepID=UPI001B319731|nr:hypothetical protein [Streptomyces sp. GESEQ-35]
MTDLRPDESADARALQFAREWAQLPPAHLRAALRALEPQMERDHELAKMERKNRHVLNIMGLISGFILAICSLGGAIYFGVRGQLWGTAVLTGPSILVMIRVFVLRKTEKSDLRLSRSALDSLGNATGQPPP